MLEVIQQYGLVFLVGDYPHGQLGGLAMTVLLSMLALGLTFPAAVLVALLRLSERRAAAGVAAGFVTVVRSIPLLMVIFWFYYFLPVLIGVPMTAFMTILLAIVLYQTAYLSEVVRAAILAIPSGQREAAQSLGLSYVPVTLRVILPQALQNAIPGILNQLIITIKETSLGYVLAFNELTYAAGQVNAMALVKPLQVFAILASVYFALCYSLSLVATHMERALHVRVRTIG